MNDVHDVQCAVAATAEIIAAKWTPLIVHDLSEGPRRFMELEHACPGISPRTLSERLDLLERHGVLMRKFGHAWLVPAAAGRRRSTAVK
jgi:DNA-binding HxlR family transcriptional regulator